jgi:segregation and condensation protein B
VTTGKRVALVSDSKGKKNMSPPRLKLVSNDEPFVPDEAGQPDDGANLTAEAFSLHAEAEAIELAAALADAQMGFAPEVSELASRDKREKLRILEALLFAAKEPQDIASLAAHLTQGDDVPALLEELRQSYLPRGVHLMRVSGKWTFRTAEDLSYLLERHALEERRLSKAALETLAIIAYHQPVTRAEIEEIRGVTTSGGTLEILMETGWARPRGRRRAPGKPITYGTTDSFLSHFGLDTIKDLPGLQDLKTSGLLDGTLPPGFSVPEPTDVAALMPDELPLEDDADAEAQDTQSELELEQQDGETSEDDLPMEDGPDNRDPSEA